MAQGLLIVFIALVSSAIGSCPFSQKVEDKSKLKEIADPETTTPNGCKCASLCGPSAEDGFTVSVFSFNPINLSNKITKI